MTDAELEAYAQMAAKNFIEAASLAGADIAPEHLEIELLPAPHQRPKRLQDGKMAVYVFLRKSDEVCFKVGKAGKKSHQRFSYQHYSRSSKSSLAKSLCEEYTELTLSDADRMDPGRWIENNLDRINFYLDIYYGPLLLNLLESFMQCVFSPRFEGPASMQLLTREEIQFSAVDQNIKDNWGRLKD